MTDYYIGKARCIKRVLLFSLELTAQGIEKAGDIRMPWTLLTEFLKLFIYTAPMKLHTKIGVGLLLGGFFGGLCNAFFAGQPWLVFVSDNIMYPAGQVFLRLLRFARRGKRATLVALTERFQHDGATS